MALSEVMKTAWGFEISAVRMETSDNQRARELLMQISQLTVELAMVLGEPPEATASHVVRYPCSATCAHEDACTPGHPERVRNGVAPDDGPTCSCVEFVANSPRPHRDGHFLGCPRLAWMDQKRTQDLVARVAELEAERDTWRQCAEESQQAAQQQMDDKHGFAAERNALKILSERVLPGPDVVDGGPGTRGAVRRVSKGARQAADAYAAGAEAMRATCLETVQDVKDEIGLTRFQTDRLKLAIKTVTQ